MLTRSLGHEKFVLVGDECGSYVAFRAALDHPAAVSKLVVMDSVPIGDALARCNASVATAWWRWFFLGNPRANAERVINADPDAWYRSAEQRARMGEEAWIEFMEAIHNPSVVHVMCEDYRAGLTVDRQDDEIDRKAGQQLAMPVLVIWSTRHDMRTLYGDPLKIWQAWGP